MIWGYFGAHTAELAGNLDDPDADGANNLMEYALGLDPKRSDLQQVSPSIDLQAGEWVFAYFRPANRSDLLYTVEVSTDLQGWTSEGVSHRLVNGSEVERWEGRFPSVNAPHVFFRLSVSQREAGSFDTN